MQEQARYSVIKDRLSQFQICASFDFVHSGWWFEAEF